MSSKHLTDSDRLTVLYSPKAERTPVDLCTRNLAFCVFHTHPQVLDSTKRFYDPDSGIIVESLECKWVAGRH